METTLLALAALGLAISTAFTLVSYRKAPPVACGLSKDTCARVVDAREARLFGLPNSVFGLAWYALVGAYALGVALPCEVLIAGAVASVVVSVFLAWALVFRLRTPCWLCFTGHALNVAILVLLWRAC